MKRRNVPDIDVRLLLDRGDRSLFDLERLPNFFLRQLQGAAHFGEFHLLAETLRLGFRPGLRRERHTGAKLALHEREVGAVLLQLADMAVDGSMSSFDR